MNLTSKQQAFCFEYAKDRNATRAATIAGYSPKTAAAQASRLLRNVNVKEKIAQLLNKSVTKQHLALDDVIGELRIIMFCDISQFCTWTDKKVTMKPSGDLTQNTLKAIESVATTTSKAGEPQLRIRLHSKLKAAELLVRIFEIQETELRLAELEGKLREIQAKS